MDKRRPQLSPDELQQLKWLLGGVLTLLAVSTIFYMDVEAWSLMAVTLVATTVTLVWPALPARLPPLAHTLAFPAIVAFFAADLWLKTEVLPAMVRLDLLLLLYRNVSYRQRRDDLQVIVLGLFLIIVAGVLTVSLLFAGQLLVYTACALAFLFTITLSDGAKTPNAKPPPPNVAPAWAQHADWPMLARRLRDVADWRVLGLGVALFAGVVAVSALLFLAIPRFQLENGMFLDRFISKRAKSGFSESIRFGDVTDIQQDTSVAMNVDVSDPDRVPRLPYWRMLVLDEYREGTWRLSARLRNATFAGERTFNALRGTAVPRRGAAVYWTYYLEAGISRYLPLVGPFNQLVFVEAQNFQFARPLNVLALRQEPVTMTAYRVEGLDVSGLLPDPAFAAVWAERDGDRASRYALQNHTVSGPNGEADRATLARLVREATGGATLPAAEFATRVGAWLRANHTYTLAPRIPGAEGDPLVRWAASHEAGHCELFAGAFVLLARTAGFPARIVTGFKGGTWNPYSGNFTIRNSDAHAWAEIFDVETGAWRRTDPLEAAAPAQANETQSAATLAQRSDRSWTARFDSLRVFWYRRIVSFDQRSQAETLKALKEATQNSGKRLRAELQAALVAAKAWLAGPWDFRRFARVGAGTVLPAGLGWLWRMLGRRWWQRLWRANGPRHEDPVRREAGRWLRRLEAEGAPDAAAVEAIAELQRLRFGARATWGEPTRVFRRARAAWRGVRRRESNAAISKR